MILLISRVLWYWNLFVIFIAWTAFYSNNKAWAGHEDEIKFKKKQLIIILLFAGILQSFVGNFLGR